MQRAESAEQSIDPGKCNRHAFVVAIDVGHSLDSPGAASARGVPEYQYNLELARLLLVELRNNGFDRAIMIEPDGREVTIMKRTVLAEESGADLLVSIHHDSVQAQYLRPWVFGGRTLYYNDDHSGYSLFVAPHHAYGEQSLRFARLLARQLREVFLHPTLHHAEAIKGENRQLLDRSLGIYSFPQLGILRLARSPAILFEAGVIVNRNEEMLLADPGHRALLVAAMLQAFIRYCAD